MTTVDQLAATDPIELGHQLGPTMGPRFVGIARGQGRTEVIGTPYVPRGRSRETTFQVNLVDWQEVRAQVSTLAEQVAADVAQEGRPVARVGVKIRFAPFVTASRSKTLPGPTREPAELTRAALEVLERFDHDRPIRLLGVRAEFEDGEEPRRANPSRGRAGLGGDAR